MFTSASTAPLRILGWTRALSRTHLRTKRTLSVTKRLSTMSIATQVDGVPAYTKQYINGAWVDSDGKGLIDVYDSNNGKVFAKVINGTKSDTEKVNEAYPRQKKYLP